MFHLGIDLGGTNIAVGVVDDNYNIVGKGKLKTGKGIAPELLAKDIAKACNIAIDDAKLNITDIADFGIACPGTVNPQKGTVVYANNIPFKDTPIVKLISDELGGLKGYIDNDANAAAYGELIAGAGVGADSFIAVTLGTGVGGGIIIDGKIFSGHNYAGAELGHMSINVDGLQCNCGNVGCWECYASATALVNQTKEAMTKNPDSAMWTIAKTLDDVSGRTAFDGMRMGDAVAQAVVDRYIQYLACGVLNLVNIFQPQFVCIGGGISNEKDTLLVPLRKLVDKGDYNRDTDHKSRVICAKLGNDAGIIGAAFLFRLA